MRVFRGAFAGWAVGGLDGCMHDHVATCVWPVLLVGRYRHWELGAGMVYVV
jgi:hypothetical protein